MIRESCFFRNQTDGFVLPAFMSGEYCCRLCVCVSKLQIMNLKPKVDMGAYNLGEQEKGQQELKMRASMHHRF